MKRPYWTDRIDAKLSAVLPVGPHMLSGAKMLVVAPLLVLALKQLGALPNRPGVVLGLFLTFCVLDYVESALARQRGVDSTPIRAVDRVADYAILVAVSIFCFEDVPAALLAVKLALSLVIMVLCITAWGSTEIRTRTGINYVTVLALLFLSQGWAPKFVTPRLAVCLLWVNVAFAAVAVLYSVGLLRKRFIADALSGANLLCGVFSMFFASRGRFDVSLLFLMLGAAFDGFDGAAARKFGGTRWGVYSDDVADGVNYGIAPGVALYFALDGVEGWALGIFYTGFTLSRLVYFTLNKANSDPDYFCGVPSTVGGLVTLCACVLFRGQPALVGLAVGVACIQMVSFDTHYRHFGRAIASNRRIIYGMPAMTVVLIVGRFLWGRQAPVAMVLAACLVYGFLPTVSHFVRLLAPRAGEARTPE